MSPTETDLEPRLIETLRTKAAQIPEVPESFDPDVVDLASTAPGPAWSRMVLIAAAVVLVVVAAVGLVIAFGGRDAGEPASPPPSEPVAAVVAVDALPELKYQVPEFRTAAGRNEIVLTSFGGTHGLVFADPALAGFRLNASEVGVPSRREVTLGAGRDYTVYCPIPGHRAAGMEAVIHVRAPAERPTKGGFPAPMPLRPNGYPDVSQMPDFIGSDWSTGADDVNVTFGYVPREYLFGTVQRAAVDGQPLYAEDLETVLGHLYANRGFVPLGVDPETVPPRVATTSTTP